MCGGLEIAISSSCCFRVIELEDLAILLENSESKAVCSGGLTNYFFAIRFVRVNMCEVHKLGFVRS